MLINQLSAIEKVFLIKILQNLRLVNELIIAFIQCSVSLSRRGDLLTGTETMVH